MSDTWILYTYIDYELHLSFFSVLSRKIHQIPLILIGGFSRLKTRKSFTHRKIFPSQY